MTEKQVLVTLEKAEQIFGGKPCIRANFEFDLTGTANEALYAMRSFHVAIKEPDRGAQPKPLGEFTGKIKKMTTPGAPKKEGALIVEFDNNDVANSALRQIGECEPATAWIYATGQELDFDEGGKDETDGQEEIDHEGEGE